MMIIVMIAGALTPVTPPISAAIRIFIGRLLFYLTACQCFQFGRSAWLQPVNAV
jgi:hypothetical protein